MEVMNANPRYRRRSDHANCNNPFLMNDEPCESHVEVDESRNNAFRRFSLQHTFTRTEAENSTESIKHVYGRIEMEGMYASGEGLSNHSQVVNLDSMGPEELRQVAIKLADERDHLAQELNAISKHNHLLRRQLNRFNLNQRWNNGRNVPGNDDNENKLLSTLIEYNSCEDQSLNESNLFIVPDDLKQSPNRISVMLSQSMTVLAQINNQEVFEKVYAGGHIAKQMVLGNAVGYCTSHVVRKFGKLVAGSIIGSACLIKLAHHRGYISVDWKRIQKQIENPSVITTESSEEDKCDDIAWIVKKVQQVREWTKQNTYTVVGFCTGFAINNFM